MVLRLGHGLDGPGFDSWHRQESFLFSKTTRLAVWPHPQSRIQRVPGLFPGAKTARV